MNAKKQTWKIFIYQWDIFRIQSDKTPLDYTEREERQISLTEGLNRALSVRADKPNMITIKLTVWNGNGQQPFSPSPLETRQFFITATTTNGKAWNGNKPWPFSLFRLEICLLGRVVSALRFIFYAKYKRMRSISAQPR